MQYLHIRIISVHAMQEVCLLFQSIEDNRCTYVMFSIHWQVLVEPL